MRGGEQPPDPEAKRESRQQGQPCRAILEESDREQIAKFRYARNGRRLPLRARRDGHRESLNHQARVAIVILAYISGINKRPCPQKSRLPGRAPCPAA
jgi:hypothetical protein